MLNQQPSTHLLVPNMHKHLHQLKWSVITHLVSKYKQPKAAGSQTQSMHA